MPEYLLPCTCGQSVRVSNKDAGQGVRCACGKMLDVPTLRGLATLERADAALAARPRAWGPRQQAVFALVLLTLAAAGMAGYLAIGLPVAPEPPELPEIHENSPLADVYAVYEDAKKGLGEPPPSLLPEEISIVNERAMKLWGIKIALAVACCGAVAIGAALLSGRRQKR